MEKKQFSTKEQSDLMRAAGEKLSNDIEKYVLPHLTPQPQSIQEDGVIWQSVQQLISFLEGNKIHVGTDGSLNEDLIYLIDRVKKESMLIQEPTNKPGGYIQDWDDIMTTAAGTQPKAQEDGWISVEKELPKEGDRVLFFDDFGVNIGYVMDEAGQTWKDEISGMLLEFQHTTHWRKLPEPPTKPI